MGLLLLLAASVFAGPTQVPSIEAPVEVRPAGAVFLDELVARPAEESVLELLDLASLRDEKATSLLQRVVIGSPEDGEDARSFEVLSLRLQRTAPEWHRALKALSPRRFTLALDGLRHARAFLVEPSAATLSDWRARTMGPYGGDEAASAALALLSARPLVESWRARVFERAGVRPSKPLDPELANRFRQMRERILEAVRAASAERITMILDEGKLDLHPAERAALVDGVIEEALSPNSTLALPEPTPEALERRVAAAAALAALREPETSAKLVGVLALQDGPGLRVEDWKQLYIAKKDEWSWTSGALRAFAEPYRAVASSLIRSPALADPTAVEYLGRGVDRLVETLVLYVDASRYYPSHGGYEPVQRALVLVGGAVSQGLAALEAALTAAPDAFDADSARRLRATASGVSGGVVLPREAHRAATVLGERLDAAFPKMAEERALVVWAQQAGAGAREAGFFMVLLGVVAGGLAAAVMSVPVAVAAGGLVAGGWALRRSGNKRKRAAAAILDKKRKLLAAVPDPDVLEAERDLDADFPTDLDRKH